jgi:hypothetical protein
VVWTSKEVKLKAGWVTTPPSHLTLNSFDLRASCWQLNYKGCATTFGLFDPDLSTVTGDNGFGDS